MAHRFRFYHIAGYVLLTFAIAAAVAVFSEAGTAAGTSTAETSGTCGENLTWEYDGTGPALTIEGSGEMYDYGEDDHAPWYGMKFERVTLPDGLTHIGDYAFDDCDSLRSVRIPGSVESIGDDAFVYCDTLTSVQVPGSVKAIGKEAFYGCDALTSVQIPGSVEDIGDSAFYSCDALTHAYLSDGVRTIGKNAFCDCKALSSVHIPGSVTSLGTEAFSGCSALTSVNIPGTLESIENGTFSECCALASVSISEGVKNIGYQAFYSCSALASLVIPDSVTSIGERSFSNCDGLSSLALGNGLKTIGKQAFSSCYGLTSLSVPGSVEEIAENAFGNCNNISKVFNCSSLDIDPEYCGLPANAEMIKGETHTVTWKDWDGTVLRTARVACGTVPQYGAVPARETEGYVCTFTEWYPEIAVVTADAVYTARYSCVANVYTVLFDAAEGVLSGGISSSAEYGSPFVFSETAKRSGYAFLGWYTLADGGRAVTSGDEWSIAGNTTLYAHWQKDETAELPLWMIAAVPAAIAVIGVFAFTVRRKTAPGDLPSDTE